MKIICCCLNAKYIHSSPAPWCLTAGVNEYCKNDDIAIEVIESTINNNQEKLIQEIVNKAPDLISFSCYIWNITQSLSVAKQIKEKISAKIVFGGPEVAYRAKDTLLSHTFIDYILSGEGEWCFPELVDAIINKSELINVHGITFRINNEIISTQPDIYYDTPPSPFSEKYLSVLNNRIAYIESSRGCPFRCAYCLSGRAAKLRFFNLAQIKNDLQLLSKSGVKIIKFVDRTFNASESHCNQILNFIKDNFSNMAGEISFHFEIAADILKESTLEILSTLPCGLIQLEIGIQTFNKDVLNSINRQCNQEKLIENIKRLIGFNNMHIHIDLIAGLTGESYNSFIRGFNKAFELKADMLQLGFLKLLYGSDMRENVEKFPCLFNENPPYEVLSTPWISNEEINSLKQGEIALDKLYNSGRFLLTIDYILSVSHLSPFELFFKFGTFCNLTELPLKELVINLFNCFKNYCNETILKEKICCDLLASGINIKLPDEIKIYSSNYKTLKKYFSEKLQTNVKIVILNSENKVYVFTNNQKDLSGRYSALIYELDNII